MKRRILVTGGAGFIGLPLTLALLKRGHQVTVLDIVQQPNVLVQREVHYIKGNITDQMARRRALAHCDTVFHLAAALPIARAGKAYFEINTDATKALIDEGIKVKKFVFVSSSAVYLGSPRITLPITESSLRQPIGQYGLSKLRAEEYCEYIRGSSFDCSIVRPRTTIGAGRVGIFALLFDWIAEHKPVPILGTGHNRYQLIAVTDLVSALCLLLETNTKNQDFNIGASVFGTVRSDLERLCRSVGSRSPVVSINPTMAQFGLSLLETLNLSPLVNIHFETPYHPFYFNTQKARRILGWQPKLSNHAMLLEAYQSYQQEKNRTSVGASHRNRVAPKLLGPLETGLNLLLKAGLINHSDYRKPRVKK